MILLEDKWKSLSELSQLNTVRISALLDDPTNVRSIKGILCVGSLNKLVILLLSCIIFTVACGMFLTHNKALYL
jgi:hypothetical protein